ncbi:MAG: class I SAM-dependent RNA methyltransferase [Deltaproteobacteria bacterium]|nr:class I SAM-dependent RNA methyltransferase [Deltaproteobacteria bacterium]
MKTAPPKYSAGCPDHCPGCVWPRLDAKTGAAQKYKWLQKRLSLWQDRLEMIRSVPESMSWGYRDKVCLGVKGEAYSWKIGLRRGDEIIPVPDCPVHTPRVKESLKTIIKMLPFGKNFPLVYYVQSGALVTLVVKSRSLPDMAWLSGREVSQKLRNAGITGVWIHMHPSVGKKVFAKKGWHLAWGRPAANTQTGLAHGPTAFRQVLYGLHERAITDAETFLAPGISDLAIDLYSGIGETLARWTDRDVETIGVELSGDAVKCACVNAPDATILRGACRQRIPQMEDFTAKWMEDRRHGQKLVYANPPRTGLEPEITDWIARKLKPDKMAYLSCNAVTLARDLELLEKGGLRVIRLIPYDFFPHTLHVETLALLG